MIEPLTKLVLEKQKPILAICLGFQLLAIESHEFGLHKGLGWIDGVIKKLPTKSLKLPHMGWNEVELKQECFLIRTPLNKS